MSATLPDRIAVLTAPVLKRIGLSRFIRQKPGRFGDHRDWLEAMARIGFAANGVVYVSIGVLAIAAAIGMRNQAVDPRGLLSVLAQQPWGRVWLVVLGAGLWAFVGWRAVQAVFDADNEGSDWRGLLVRASQAIGGLFYAVIASGVFELLDEVGPGMQAADLAENQHKAAILLGLPFGAMVLTLIGLGIGGVGIGNVVMGAVNDFGATLVCSKTVRRWVIPLARLGYAARGLAYLPLALFITLAGWRAQASEVTTFGGALQALERQPGGAIILAFTGAGLLAFGFYAFVEARFRHIRPPKDLKPS